MLCSLEFDWSLSASLDYDNPFGIFTKAKSHRFYWNNDDDDDDDDNRIAWSTLCFNLLPLSYFFFFLVVNKYSGKNPFFSCTFTKKKSYSANDLNFLFWNADPKWLVLCCFVRLMFYGMQLGSTLDRLRKANDKFPSEK